MAAYATPAQFILRYDVRVIGDILSTTGTQLTEAQLLVDPKLATHLLDGAGEIDSAVMAGSRYTTAQLAALTGNGAAYIASLNCQVSFFLAIDRKFNAAIPDHLAIHEDRYQRILKMLRTGERIFDIEEVKEAGLPSQVAVTSVELIEQNTMTSRVRGNMYPMRIMPFGRE